MTNPKFKKIGVVANLKKKEVKPILADLVSGLVDDGFEVFVEPRTQPFIDPNANVEVGISRGCDVILSLGGDGTILHVARQFERFELPILGLNVGRLGFLAETLGSDIVDKLKSGRYTIQDRMRIKGRLMEGDVIVSGFSALNDIVVHGAGFSRMIHVKTTIDGTPFRDYRADGVIVSTPTGSTAYSLSADGPLMAPTMEAILVTPLCPHSMSARPIVLDSNETIKFEISGARSRITVTVDGQEGSYMGKGQYLMVEKSQRVTRLVVPDDYDFYSLLREKL
ncbi:MAG: NAD(+)/NADH kinase [Candidatus Latescibacterota bacterium]|nr:MAG: NAD(+)/NADH kinase [Candidatus Latescibacterota bacterium]